MKKYLINWVIKQLLQTKVYGVDNHEELRTLALMNQVVGLDTYLKALISSDMVTYYSISEDKKELRLMRKGMVMRTKWLLDSMQTASAKLKALRKEE